MSNQLSNNQSFSEMMQKSKLVMPFSDFEERTMARINQEVILKASFPKYKKLAILFFIIGTGFGCVMMYFLSLPETGIAGIPSDTILLLCHTGYVLLVLFLLNNILASFSVPGKYRITWR